VRWASIMACCSSVGVTDQSLRPSAVGSPGGHKAGSPPVSEGSVAFRIGTTLASFAVAFRDRRLGPSVNGRNGRNGRVGCAVSFMQNSPSSSL
jgi:hypothetical protein